MANKGSSHDGRETAVQTMISMIEMVSATPGRNATIDDLRNGLFKLVARFNPSYDSSRKSINSRAPLRNSGLEFFE